MTTSTLNAANAATLMSYVFADDDLHIGREITVQATSEKEARMASWAMLSDSEKDACGCWSCVDETPVSAKQFEFAIIHRVSRVNDQVRATALSQDAAHKAVVDYYGVNFEVADLPCNVRPAHCCLGEIDCL